MLEIAAIILLVIRNKKNAIARGRKPGAFIALTIILWFGFEIIGAVIGVLAGLDILIAALLGLGTAAIGGLISYLVTKSCKPGDYYTPVRMGAYSPMPPVSAPLPPVQPLDTPATIDIVRDYSLKGDITSWKFILNGETVGSLGNGAMRSTTTQQQHNILRAVSDDGLECAPLQFDIESAGRAEIHFKGDRFERESCTGIMPISVPLMPPSMPVMPYAPPVTLRRDPLAVPTQINIVRDSHQDSASTVWSFSLNEVALGGLADGQILTATTGQQQNLLRALPERGMEPPPLIFIVQSGGAAEIHFKNGTFMPYESSGIMPPQMPAMYAPPQMPPPYGPPPFMPQASTASAQPVSAGDTTCPQCSAPVQWNDQYCRKCGAKQPGAEQL